MTRSYSLAFGVSLLLATAASGGNPIPHVTVTPSAANMLIGTDFKFCVTFDNQGGANDEGFAPFIDVVLDTGGTIVSGSPHCDGVTFVSANVTSTNPAVPLQPVQSAQPTAPCGSGSSAHPFGSLVAIPSFPAGGELVTLPLPFGSFESSQPPVMIEVTVHADHFATMNHPLRVAVRGGFQFGGSATGSPMALPTTAPPTWQACTLHPLPLILKKTYLDAENEIVPGPNTHGHYETDVNYAPGQTIQGLVLHDCGTSNLIVDSTVVTPATSGAVTPAGACNDITFTQLGPSGPSPTITTTFHVSNTPVIGVPNCTAIVDNTVTITAGSWQPLDPADPLVNPLLGIVNAPITAKAIAITKSTVPSTIGGPGSTFAYILKFRMSDFLRMKNFVVDDWLSDGQSIVGTPTLKVSDQTGSYGPVPIQAANPTPVPSMTYKCPPDTSSVCAATQNTTVSLPATRYTFNVSATMAGSTNPTFQQGTLTGGAIPAGGVAAEGEIDFQVQIDDTMHYPQPGHDAYVDKDDPIDNTATIRAEIINKLTAGHFCSDDTTSCRVTPGDQLAKYVFAQNGVAFNQLPNPVTSPPHFNPHDTITYQLTKTLPTGDAEALSIEDFFPQPVLSVSAFPNTLPPLCTGVPAVNTACYGGLQPTQVTVDASSNAVKFDYGNVQNTANAPVTIQILITLEVSTAPFADDLLLTNEAMECENNSYGGPICQSAIAEFVLNEPQLFIHKAVFCAPSSCVPPFVICQGSCPRVTSVVNSSNLASFLATHTANVDAGDRATFIVAVENRGHHDAWDVKVSDVAAGIPTVGFIVPGTFCVWRGDHAPITLVAGSGLTSTGFHLELVDGSTTGGLAATSPTSGANILLITFDVKLNPSPFTTIGSCITNRASLVNYSNHDTGTNFVPQYGGPACTTNPNVFCDDASLCVLPKSVQKTIITTSEAHTPNGGPWNVVIGEIVRFQLVVEIPEGHIATLPVIDNLPAGMTIVGTPVVTKVNVNTSLTYGSFALSGNTFTFTNLHNNDHDPDCEYLVIKFNAIVNNDLSNQAGTVLTNSCSVLGVQSNVVTMHVVEPQLAVMKDLQPFTEKASTVIPAGHYIVTITNTSNVTAFDVSINDTWGSCLVLDPMKPPPAATLNGNSIPYTNPLTISAMPPGSVVKIDYYLMAQCANCAAMTNDAVATWSSLPGAGTVVNPTGSVAGTPGTCRGERNGTGAAVASPCAQVCPLTDPQQLCLNDYRAAKSLTLCRTVRGTKVDNNQNGLPGWTIQSGSVSTTTDLSGNYTLVIPPGVQNLPISVCEVLQPGWTAQQPSSGCQNVTVANGQTVTGVNFVNHP